MWSRSSWPGSRRPPGAEGGPRARGERSDLERLPPPPLLPVTPLGRSPTPRPEPAGALPPTRTGYWALAAMRPRDRAPGSAVPTSRTAPTRSPHSRAAPAPLSGHPWPSAWPPRPPPGGCPESAVARGWRRGGGGPGTTRRLRRRRLASLVPALGFSRPPQARGGPLPSASLGSRRRRRQSRAEATVTATATGETVQPRLRRAGAVPARCSAGGAAALALAPPPAPPRRPRPARPRRKPPARPRCRPLARPRASGAQLRAATGSRRAAVREVGAPRVVLPRRVPFRGRSWKVMEESGKGAAQLVQRIREGRPSATRPSMEESGPQNLVSAHCKITKEERTT